MKPTATIFTLMLHSASAGEFDFVKELHIAAPPDAVWRAIMRPEIVAKYHLAPLHRIEPHKGGVILYGAKEQVMISGTITAVEENTLLSHTFRFGPADHPGIGGDPDTIVTYTLRKDGNGTRLTLTHSGFSGDSQTRANITGGWPHILEGLKATVEGRAEN